MRSTSSALAVSISTGICDSARIRRRTSKPLTSGSIKHGQGTIAADSALCAFCARGSGFGFETVGFQIFRQHLSKVGIVIDDQDSSHDYTPLVPLSVRRDVLLCMDLRRNVTFCRQLSSNLQPPPETVISRFRDR